ncbi:hypothetical protein Bca52824_081371 [Brassica carinata]|uniref:Uncharacterized protein n=1 Tax=Brassica carinata TaxID=52824 RepID=A0A8X7TQX2_BRACI|nr:hypothetical protein Bca52824_081371 [Brassica carinata]
MKIRLDATEYASEMPLTQGANDLPGAAADKTSLSPVVNRVVQQRQKAILLMVWSRKGTAKTDPPTDPLLMSETLEEEPALEDCHSAKKTRIRLKSDLRSK